jgi:DNA-binding transcriptional ArsR family regulator
MVFSSGDEITLDRETFKVLASETRIDILKKLDERQMTVSDLAKSMKMNKATLYEHLEKMVNIGLIKKIKGERKWVYYKVTWKGKNILHPQRTKIIVLLSVFLVCFLVLAVVFSCYLAGLASNRIGDPTDGADVTAPTVEFIDADDITDKTASPPEMRIKVEDNKQLDGSSLQVQYVITDDFQDLDEVGGWSEIPASLDGNTVSVTFPASIDWSLHSGKFLYVRCRISDEAGNWAQDIYVEHIDSIYEGSLDISISVSDVVFDKEWTPAPPNDGQTIPLTIKVHNTGSIDVHNTMIALYSYNPDSNNDGIVDDDATPIKTESIHFLLANDVETIETDIKLNFTTMESIRFWVAVDPSNSLNESNEQNNIAQVDYQLYHTQSVIPEFSHFVVAFLAIAIVIMFAVFRRKGKHDRS